MNNFRKWCLLWLIAVTITTLMHYRASADVTAPSVDPHVNETKAQRDARMGWFRSARFGMFIHWGLYAHYAGSFNGVVSDGPGEWIMHDEKIPVTDYAAGASSFNPTSFNAETWVSIAKAAGMKYIVMTAKHHEGFAMYHTSVDGYNIYDATPFKRDPIAEMAAACKRQGIKFGVYYSQAQDWHHAGGAAYGGHWDPAQDGDLHAYVKNIAAPQLHELLTKYHPAVLWWDTPVAMSPDDIRALTSSFADDPGLIANNRLGNGVPGDTITPEQYVPATGFKGDWETCMTINNTWGFKTQDTDFKSTTLLLHNLVDIASKGGNYLLNVGPDSTGVIPQAEVDRLEQIGAWLKVNGQSIYGTTASVLAHLPSNERLTVKGKTLYLHVFDWHEGTVSIPGLLNTVSSATVLGTKEHLPISKNADGVTVIQAPSQPDPLDTVVVLKIEGALAVSSAAASLHAATDGSFDAAADTANLTGALQIEGQPTHNIGFWTNASDTPSWTLAVPAGGGDYSVQVVYSCENGTGGSTFNVEAGKSAPLAGTTTDTGTWQDYVTLHITGHLHLEGGQQTLTIVPTSKPGEAVMNLREIVLSPSQ